jgi:hypothetical protein
MSCVFRKNEFNAQYMNNRRSRWPCDMRSLDCRYRRFESRSEHGCSSLGFDVLCVVMGLWDGIVLRNLRLCAVCVCVCVCVCV